MEYVRCKVYCKTKKANCCCYICKDNKTCFLSCTGENFKTDFKTYKSKILLNYEGDWIIFKQICLFLIMLFCCITLYKIL